MDLSSVSAGAAVMAVSQQSAAADRTTAVLAMAQRQQKQEGAALVSLIESAAPLPPGVGQNLSVYA